MADKNVRVRSDRETKCYTSLSKYLSVEKRGKYTINYFIIGEYIEFYTIIEICKVELSP
jgi:hypothetical protein